MSKKNIIFIIIMVVAIIGIVIFSNSNKNKNNNEGTKVYFKGFGSASEELKEGLDRCQAMYKKDSNDNTFYTVFNIDFINQYLTNKITYVHDYKLVDFDLYEIYDANGNKIDNFPYKTVIDVSVDNYVIEPDTDSLIKLFNNDDGMSYYYIINISKTGDYKLTEVCFTKGEYDEASTTFEDSVDYYLP